VDSPSLEGLDTVVASPLLDGAGRVLGALYGELRRGGGGMAAGGKLEAILVELLAGGVSAGLARQEQQRAALQAQALFNQFFTPSLADHLLRQPDLLSPREADVTVLFCDIRDFSKISEAVGPATTQNWINSVLSTLSRCVLDHGGVLVDYIGDELLAMWGAPVSQPDHAPRAATAALAMLEAREALDHQWRERLKNQPTELGIGLNTGTAQVGNMGSEQKFKYGPLGNTVNIASRTQGLTKYLGCRVLMTEETRNRLGAGFLGRRVCRARLVNIQEPVVLYDMALAGDGRAEFFRLSDEAVTALEAGEFATAARRAGELLQSHREDGPLLLTLSRAAQALMHRGEGFDPVWTPPGK
jgi:adenylate cyclase